MSRVDGMMVWYKKRVLKQVAQTRRPLVAFLTAITFILWAQVGNAQSIVLEDFETPAVDGISGLDNFAERFPPGTSPIRNFAGTSGYIRNFDLALFGPAGLRFPTTTNGTRYGILHSAGAFDQEVIQATLGGTSGRPPLFEGIEYELNFLGAWLNVNVGPTLDWTVPGQIKIYGQRAGTNSPVRLAFHLRLV